MGAFYECKNKMNPIQPFFKILLSFLYYYFILHTKGQATISNCKLKDKRLYQIAD